VAIQRGPAIIVGLCVGSLQTPLRRIVKDTLLALDALGITLPSTAYIIGTVIFGIVGFVAYRFGKKMSLPATKWIGVALMLYPYAVSATWLLYVVGVALCFGAYLTARP